MPPPSPPLLTCAALLSSSHSPLFSNRDYAFCAHAILPVKPTTLIVEDAALDERFKESPLVTGAPFIRFVLKIMSPFFLQRKAQNPCLSSHVPPSKHCRLLLAEEIPKPMSVVARPPPLKHLLLRISLSRARGGRSNTV